MTTEDLKGIVHSDPEIMGGAPIFVGTRVPLRNLVDALKGGESIEDFLKGFPSVTRSQAIAVIEAGQMKMFETVGLVDFTLPDDSPKVTTEDVRRLEAECASYLTDSVLAASSAIMPIIIKKERFTGIESLKRSFEDALLIDCRFEDYELEGANLMSTVFVDCSFKKVDFYWASMFRAKFIRCMLEDVSLRGANMEETIFVKCSLVRCDFSHDNLGGNTDLSLVTFHDCSQMGCDYTKFKRT